MQLHDNHHNYVDVTPLAWYFDFKLGTFLIQSRYDLLWGIG